MSKLMKAFGNATFVASISILIGWSPLAFAQENEEEATDEGDAVTMEEVIVTVERREQNLQDLGATAYSFEGENLKMQGVVDLTDLSELAPGLEIGNKGGNVEVWIRGVGSSNNTELGDPAAATHLDGVYLPRTAGIGSAFFDVGRVEVNVGPQGTLRGRNATAGSVNVIPWRPGMGRQELAIEVERGDYDTRVRRGVVNVPLGANAAFRLAGYAFEHDSYYNDVGPLDLDLAEAADNTGYRAQLAVDVTERLSVLIAYDKVHETGSGWTGTNYANPLGNGIDPEDIEDPRDVYARAFTPMLDTTHWGAKLELTYDFDFATAEFVVSRRDLLYNYDAATPLAPDWEGVADTLQPVDEVYDNWSRFQFITDSVSDIQEFRLFGDSGAWTWTAGLFHFIEDQYTFLGSVGDRGLFFQGVEFNQPTTDSESSSVYSDITYHLNDITRLTGGLRYTTEDKMRVGVNARYALALGGRNFSCCGGVRLGTEGFRFAARDRTIFEPDANGDGTVSDEEYLAFYYDGIAQFGARDNFRDVLAKGTYGGAAAPEDKVPCVDTQNQDDFFCPPDGLFSFVAIINPNSSITPQFGEMSNSFIDWRLRIERDFGAALGYAMVSTGHKSGGFNDTFTGETGLPVAPTYDEEQVVVYEAGWKNEFELGETPTRFNMSGFYYDYTDQVFTSLLSVEQALDFTVGGATLIDPTETGAGSLVVSFSYNAADSQIYGMQFDGGFNFPSNVNFDWKALWLEASIQSALPIQDFRFQADVAPDEAIFRSIDGRRLPHTPKFQLNGSLSQVIGVPWGTVDWVVSIGWRSDQYRTIFNSIDFLQPNNPRLRLNDEVEGFVSVDMGIGYSHQNDRFRIEGFVSNVTGDVHEAAQIITQFDNTRFFTRPRLAGIRASYRFGDL
ncbi:MAG: TonB-dependent receptor plug domain-containing protein [Gammaproteobacteria bacterium]|nr:TonB-dependent receptor plug domain-containing protein [Gammaproteobacteria bacterium]